MIGRPGVGHQVFAACSERLELGRHGLGSRKNLRRSFDLPTASRLYVNVDLAALID
jgi:hypothetical protein